MASHANGKVEPEKKVAMYRDKLKTEWNRGSMRNMKVIHKLLEDAKLVLIESQFLVRRAGAVPETELTMARDILEIGVFYSILKDKPEIELFERYMAQLKAYYFDYGVKLQDSPYMYEILGANLLCLLTEGRLAEFHTELEFIFHPVDRIAGLMENVFIKRAVELSQALEEGRYRKIAEEDGPQKKSALWHYFITKLCRSSRVELADTLERSYKRIDVNFADKSLGFKDAEDKAEFMKTRDWNPQDGFYNFNDGRRGKASVPSTRIIEDALAYAKHMETIV